MRYQFVLVTGLLAASMPIAALHAGADQALPVKSGRPAVAAVGGEAISLDEFILELGTPGDRPRLLQGRATAKDLEVLQRLVRIRLIVQEAATMGLDEVPEIQKQLEVSSREILREVLFERVTKNVKPDPAAVEKLFREQVREWKTTSLLFQDEAAAQRARKEIAGGAAFADVAAKAVAAKAARTDGDDAYHPKHEYLPQIAQAIAALRPGQVSPVIRFQAGSVLVKVVDIRYPENAEARAQAQRVVVTQQQTEVLKAREQALRREYAVVDSALLKSINYEAAKPGIDALLKDTRVVARLKGAPPVTVGDLTDYLRMQFFHGSDQASQRKRMNGNKEIALDATLGRRLWNMEAARLGIDKTNEYRDRVNGYRQSLVFESFLQKVIVPESKMREEEVKTYYNTHIKDYSYPEMRRMRGLAFTRRAAAEDALRKLKEGTDYNWLAANAGNQVARGSKGLLVFDAGPPMTTASMPDGVQKAVAGARTGEARLYASPEGYFYVLVTQQVIVSDARPYAEVRDEISKKLYAEKLQKAVDDYADKLGKQSKVELYLKKVQ